MFPNASTDHKNEPALDCTAGCLFDIQSDPYEYTDLAKSMPAQLTAMAARFNELAQSRYEAPKWPLNKAKCQAYLDQHQGFLGPYYPLFP